MDTPSKGKAGWIAAFGVGILLALGTRETVARAGVATTRDSSSFKTPRKLTTDGIKNFFQLSDRIYSGGQPEGEAGFAALQKRGVKTIISVDGTRPDVETAARFGLRYVHIPFGYDGVLGTNAVRLVKAAQVFPGAVFIHCHHGQHRGPAAAAIVCEGLEGWTAERAHAWLELAGTDTNYAGLFKVVREFRPPGAEELATVATNFPTCATLPGLVEAMVQIDHQFDALKAVRLAGFRPPVDQPDLSPGHESLLLWESFREARRLDSAGQRGPAFLADLAAAEARAGELHRRLASLGAEVTPAGREAAEMAFHRMADTCVTCHVAHRN